MTFPAGGGFPMGTADAVAGWDFEIGTFGPRTTSTATSASGDGMVIYAASLMPVLALAAAKVGSTAHLTFELQEGSTLVDVERRQVVGGVPGAWSHIGFGDMDAPEYDDTPGAGVWQYRVRAASGDYEYNPSRSAYSATVQVTI